MIELMHLSSFLIDNHHLFDFHRLDDRIIIFNDFIVLTIESSLLMIIDRSTAIYHINYSLLK